MWCHTSGSAPQVTTWKQSERHVSSRSFGGCVRVISQSAATCYKPPVLKTQWTNQQLHLLHKHRLYGPSDWPNLQSVVFAVSLFPRLLVPSSPCSFVSSLIIKSLIQDRTGSILNQYPTLIKHTSVKHINHQFKNQSMILITWKQTYDIHIFSHYGNQHSLWCHKSINGSACSRGRVKPPHRLSWLLTGVGGA